MSVRFIPASDPGAWRAALPPDADVYAEAAYVTAHTSDGTALLARADVAGGWLAVPLVERAIPAFLGGGDLVDAESPYGYPGVMGEGSPESIARCWDALTAALAERRLVNLFLRLHPFVPNPGVDRYLLPQEHPTAYIPLDEAEGPFEGSVCKTHRSQVRRGLALGLRAETCVAPGPDVVSDFWTLYHSTMDRLSASDFYRFSETPYAKMLGALADRAAIIRVRDDGGRTITAGMFLRGPHYGHYHLSGRVDDAHNTAGHLVFAAAAEWGLAHRLRALHLGGGTRPTTLDPLYQYKARIGRGRSCFRTAGVIVRPSDHERLRERWIEQSGGLMPLRFQSYRTPVSASR